MSRHTLQPGHAQELLQDKLLTEIAGCWSTRIGSIEYSLVNPSRRRGQSCLEPKGPGPSSGKLQRGERQRTRKNLEARLYIKRKSVNVS